MELIKYGRKIMNLKRQENKCKRELNIKNKYGKLKILNIKRKIDFNLNMKEKMFIKYWYLIEY